MEGSSGANNNMPVSLKQAKLVSDREHLLDYISTNTSEQQHGEGCLPACFFVVVVVVVVGTCACVGRMVWRAGAFRQTRRIRTTEAAAVASWRGNMDIVSGLSRSRPRSSVSSDIDSDSDAEDTDMWFTRVHTL